MWGVGYYQLIREKTNPYDTCYRVTIRLRGLGVEVGSQGSGVERRRL